ncbi:MAG: hypothetical protein ACREPX_04865 [Rhodanobacteraceae bacterium]
MSTILASMALLVSTTIAAAPPAAPLKPATASVAVELATQFDKHPLMMFAEWHRNAQQHEFLRALIRDPAFLCRIDDIVIEFGNARLQKIADAYVAGESVTEAQLQSMYRETEVPYAWNSPVYREFYETVREVNQKHVCPHPVRLLLGDPPIDWAAVKTGADFLKVEDRDRFFANLAEREVLAKNRRGILISGALHALKGLPPPEPDDPGLPNAAQLIEKEFPGKLFSVALVTTPEAAKTFGMGPPPSFRVVDGALADADFAIISPAWGATQVIVNGKHEWKLDDSKSWPPMGKVVDGLVYLGGDKKTLFPSPTIYLEPVYQEQLRQRARIIKDATGQDFMPTLNDLIEEAKNGQETQHP